MMNHAMPQQAILLRHMVYLTFLSKKGDCNMMKRVLSILMAMMLMFSLITYASAETIVILGDWSLEKVGSDWEIDAYNGTQTDVTVPAAFGEVRVVSLGDYAFVNNTALTAVTTASPMRIIGKYVFNGCTALESVTLPASLTKLGEGVFSETSSLTSINLENTSVTDIPAYAFLNSGIVSIELPSTCTSIGHNAFLQCVSLMKIVIPNSVTEIADTAFDGCEGLKIYCYTGSAAQMYAEENDIAYVLLDADPETVTFVLGDADGDGVVTITDATTVQRVLANLAQDQDGMIALRAAMNGDELNIFDATTIQRYLAQYSVTPAVGTTVTRTIG